MANSPHLFPSPINQYVLFPEIDGCLCAHGIELAEDIGAHVKIRVKDTGELQVFATKGYELTSSPAWYDACKGPILWHGGCKKNLYVSV